MGVDTGSQRQFLGLLDGEKLEVSRGFVPFDSQGTELRHVFPLGAVPRLNCFTCTHRYEPFWMTAKAGTDLTAVPPETQYLLAQLESGEYVLIVPLVDGVIRCSLQGNENSELELVAETGDSGIPVTDFTGLYVARGVDPFELMATGAREVSEFLGTTRLRREKPLPAFADWFGWCTWDASVA